MFGAYALKTILLDTEQCTLKCRIEKAGLHHTESASCSVGAGMSVSVTEDCSRSLGLRRLDYLTPRVQSVV